MGLGLCETGEQETVAETMMPTCLRKTLGPSLDGRCTGRMKNTKLSLPCMGNTESHCSPGTLAAEGAFEGPLSTKALLGKNIAPPWGLSQKTPCQ